MFVDEFSVVNGEHFAADKFESEKIGTDISRGNSRNADTVGFCNDVAHGILPRSEYY